MNEKTTVQVHDYRVPTTNLKLASVLATLGVPLKQSDPTTIIYSDKHPKSSGGQITFHFESASKTGLKTADVIQAFEDGKADVELDKVLESLPQPHRADIEKLLPLALACYMKGALENRTRLLDLAKNSTKYVYVPRGKGFVLINERASEETKRKLLK